MLENTGQVLPCSDPELHAGRLFIARSDDVNRQAAFLRGWDQTYNQISSGKFAGSLVEAHVDAARLFSETTNQTLFQSGELPSTTIAIGLPEAMRGPALFCGMESRSSELYVFSGGSGFEFFSPPDLTMLGLVVPRAALSTLLSDAEREFVEIGFGHAGLAEVDERAVASMRGFVRGVLDIFAASPHLLQNHSIMTALNAGMMSNLAALLVSRANLQSDRLTPHRRWSVVSQARDAVLSHPDEPLSIAELCRNVGVSRRTLQYCFQDTLNLNPIAFLRAVRLNGARRMLRNGSSVTVSATSWGFWHFGHFAREYATLFGERPSETLGRRLSPAR